MMNTHHVLLFCFMSAASSGLSSAQVVSATGTEGQGLTVRCHFSLSANKKFFCKGDCKKDNILIETSESKAQKGRYTIESLGTVQSTVLLVTIKPLTKSDTGLYKCGMGALFIDLQEVYLTVRAAPTTSSPSSVPSVTVDQVTDQAAEYYFILCVPVVVLLLAAVLVFLYKKKTRRNVDGLNTRMSLDDRNMKIEPYENSAFHTREDGIYESLDPVSRDQDQTYSTLSHTHNTTDTAWKGFQH